MKTFNESKEQIFKQSNFTDYRKASVEAIIAIGKAFIAEMDEAMAQNRHATLEGVDRRLSASNSYLQ